MEFRSSPNYVHWIRAIREAKQLHSIVEDRLIQIMSQVVPEYHPIKEPQGLAGGRNDLLLFDFSGRKVLFEIFASKSQVSRDLRILDKTKADIKIAIIIDKDIDRGIIDKFLMENPEDNYPYLFIGEIFEEDTTNCILKLRELVIKDDNAKIQRILRSRLKSQDFYKVLRGDGIEVLVKEDITSGEITYLRVFVTLVLTRLVKMGVSKTKVNKLGKWLSQNGLLHFVFLKLIHGMNVFLYTDLDENMAIYSDLELVDWIRAMHSMDGSYILVSLNSVVYEIQDKLLRSSEDKLIEKDVSVYIGSSTIYNSNKGRSVHFSLPKDTHTIKVLIPPAEINSRTNQDYLDMIEFYRPGDITEE